MSYTLPNNTCPICGKYKKINANHDKCARIMQAKHTEKNKRRSRPSKRLSQKNIDQITNWVLKHDL